MKDFDRYYDPPESPSYPDNLPIGCAGCGSDLGDCDWSVEEDYDLKEVDGRLREVKVLNWFTTCPNEECGKMILWSQ